MRLLFILLFLSTPALGQAIPNIESDERQQQNRIEAIREQQIQESLERKAIQGIDDLNSQGQSSQSIQNILTTNALQNPTRGCFPIDLISWRTSLAEIALPSSGIRNQESGIRNQESGIRNQESGIRS